MKSRYGLKYKKTAVRDVEKISPQIKKRLKLKIEWWVTQKKPLDFAERLTKPATAQFRYRIGSYRVLFDVEGSDIIILRVRHRRELYKK